MTDKETGAKTLGQAIDEIIRALEPLEQASRITAIRASCEHLNIPFGEKVQSVPSAREPLPSEVSTATPPSNIKSFKEQKNPESAIEMAAVVAFYLAELAPEEERKPAVDVKDMEKYFKQAGFPLPKYLKDLLLSAKSAGYFDSAGGGKYKLNPVGYNLVAHNLPRSKSKTSAKQIRSRKQTRRSRKS